MRTQEYRERYSRAEFLKKLVNEGVVSKRHILVAAQELSGQSTPLGFSKFERNVDIMRLLRKRFRSNIPKEVLKAALFYEVPDRVAGNLGSASKIALAANELSRSRVTPAEFSSKVATVASADAFLINATALLHGLQKLAEAKPGSTLATHPQRRAIADLALGVHVPLAGLLGLHSMKNELGEHALRVLDPELHLHLDAALEDAERMRKRDVPVLKRVLSRHARSIGGKHVEVHARPHRKLPFSAWEKFQRKGWASIHGKMDALALVRKLHDVIGFRIILHADGQQEGVRKIRELASRLSQSGNFDNVVIHNDYLGENKKPNGFESLNLELHKGKYNGEPIKYELQIQTADMYQRSSDAEAAHALHKSVKLPLNLVSAIQAVGRGVTYRPRGVENVSLTLYDGTNMHRVKIAAGETLLHGIAKALTSAKLAGGFSIFVPGQKDAKSLPLSFRPTGKTTLHFVQDAVGHRPSLEWLRLTRHPTVLEAISLASNQGESNS